MKPYAVIMVTNGPPRYTRMPLAKQSWAEIPRKLALLPLRYRQWDEKGERKAAL
jgi:hypothetical protein